MDRSSEIPRTRNAMETEAEAIRWAVLMVFESDAIRDEAPTLAILPLCHDIRELLFHGDGSKVVFHPGDRIAREFLFHFLNHVPRLYTVVLG